MCLVCLKRIRKSNSWIVLPIQIVEEETKKELEENKRSLAALDALNTDDENDEEEYEAWKVRELKRIKRDREDREAWVMILEFNTANGTNF